MTENLVQIGYSVFLEIVYSINAAHHTTLSAEAEVIVTQTVQEVRKQAPTKADLQVYVPIVQKYGTSRGAKMIARSIRGGLPSE